jgi:hypothetical protein
MEHENLNIEETANSDLGAVMGSLSTVHYKCKCGWKGTIHELGKDYDAMECGGEEYYFCPKCRCESGLSLNCP